MSLLNLFFLFQFRIKFYIWHEITHSHIQKRYSGRWPHEALFYDFLVGSEIYWKTMYSDGII